jgi:hypothetical protein
LILTVKRLGKRPTMDAAVSFVLWFSLAFRFPEAGLVGLSAQKSSACHRQKTTDNY